MFFDEQFKYVDGNFSRVGNSGTVKDYWAAEAQLQDIPVPKNGYLFVYVSNESNFDVFFDNLQIIHKLGPVLEETHYYPFGLTMAGISSKAAGVLQNKLKYNGKELQRRNLVMEVDWNGMITGPECMIIKQAGSLHRTGLRKNTICLTPIIMGQ